MGVWLADHAAVLDPDARRPINVQRQQECERKRRYTTRASAEKALARLQLKDTLRIVEQGHQIHEAWPLHIYHCRYYDHWHVGHVPADSRGAS